MTHRALPLLVILCHSALAVTWACTRAVASNPGDAGGAILASPRRTAPQSYVSIVIPDVPHVQQAPDFCGEAAAESWLSALSVPITQAQVFELSGMDPERGMGATTRELDVALKRIGFDTGTVFSSIAADSAVELDEQFAALHSDLMRRVPSIVCMHFDERPNTTEHFRLILGYDAATDEVIYHEPAYPHAAYQRMPRRRLLTLWPLKYDAQRWTVIRLRLEGKAVFATAQPIGHSNADYAQHVMRLRQGNARGLSVVLEMPFAVIGDGTRETVRARAVGTVRWATTRLKRDFFSRDPDRILDIWLLETEQSYRSKAFAITGSEPTTPFGFYSSEHDALVMNIATGGGTLVHEIVHPYIEANFPACPAWFNEGLGSLFEQAADRDGHIVGLTNWRLQGLKNRIARRKLPSFEQLFSTSTRQFYEQDPGSNYAQARYLLYYLQEHELLVRYYHEFLQNHAKDPNGSATLRQVLREPDLAAFQRRWEGWVLGLRFTG